MDPRLITVRPGEMSLTQAESVAQLMGSVYGGMHGRPQLYTDGVERPLPSRWFDSTPIPWVQYTIWEGDRAVAYAATFPWTIYSEEKPIEILALRSVATARNRRQRGLGSEVVRSAFRETHRQARVACVFGTEIPRFYERLGAIQVENSVVYRAATKRFRMKSWDGVMIYLAEGGWPAGTIDIRRRPW